jgi:hypothetical protein
MADPIITPQLLAAAGAGIGALSKPRNPLQGALLGGIAGYSGGTALGFGAPTAVTPVATTAAGTSAELNALAAATKAQPALSYGANNLLAPVATNANTAGLSFAGRSAMDPTMLNVTNAAPSFAEKVGIAGKSAYAHPGESLTALSATNSLLQPEPLQQSAPVNVQAGRGVKPYDFVAAMDPYRQSVIGGNQPISLLG